MTNLAEHASIKKNNRLGETKMRRLLLTALLFAGVAGAASAADYPDHPIRLIVPQARDRYRRPAFLPPNSGAS